MMDTRGTLNVNYKEPEESSFKIIEVPVNTIDNFVQGISLNRIDFLKIDVEGHEDEVLKGGLSTIKKFKPIIQIEIEQRHNDFHISRIFDRIKEMGYSCYYFDPVSLRFVEQNEDPALLQKVENFKTPIVRTLFERSRPHGHSESKVEIKGWRFGCKIVTQTQSCITTADYDGIPQHILHTEKILKTPKVEHALVAGKPSSNLEVGVKGKIGFRVTRVTIDRLVPNNEASSNKASDNKTLTVAIDCKAQVTHQKEYKR